MALGGGTWLTENKVLPGSYINFSSIAPERERAFVIASIAVRCEDEKKQTAKLKNKTGKGR